MVTGDFAGRPILLLVSVGARTGHPHVTPLLYTMDGDDFVVAAANGGSTSHPAWYRNVISHPVVTIELGRERFPALASVARGAERTRLFDERLLVMPRIQEYQDAAQRCIPFVLLKRNSPKGN
jgi:deazaflavin-dependent oxidoreductase (nitroreductase family)